MQAQASAQSMIVFVTSICDVLKTHIFLFHQSSSNAVNLHDNMLASALDKVATFADEVLFERKLPTSITREATLGERQVNQMYQIQKTGKRKHNPYFQFDKNKS